HSAHSGPGENRSCDRVRTAGRQRKGSRRDGLFAVASGRKQTIRSDEDIEYTSSLFAWEERQATCTGLVKPAEDAGSPPVIPGSWISPCRIPAPPARPSSAKMPPQW